RRGLDLPVVAGDHTRGQAFSGERALELARGGTIGERCNLRPMPDAELGKLFPLPMRGERRYGETVGMPGNDIERRIADRPRCAQHADVTRCHLRYACASS